MSQASDSPPRTPPPMRSRAAASRHLSSSGFSDFHKPASPQLSTPFLNFMRKMRRELLDHDPNTPRKSVMKAVIKAWSALPPEKRAVYGAGESFNAVRVPAKPRSESPASSPRKAAECSDLCEAETGQSDSFPVDSRSGWAAALGSMLKKVADYFIVRPF